jgi:hypothetical protein
MSCDPYLRLAIAAFLRVIKDATAGDHDALEALSDPTWGLLLDILQIRPADVASSRTLGRLKKVATAVARHGEGANRG